ncbi:MAG TPA: cytochrome c3 family protein [Candidatus Eisenbacteria bacterium]
MNRATRMETPYRDRPERPGLRRALVPLLASLALVAASRPAPLRTTAEIEKILARGPHAGECEQCHVMHGAETSLPELHALVGPDDNSLCDRCHTSPWTTGSYAGTWIYAGSSHGSSPNAAWPGPSPPARTELGAAGKCVNCHDAHGWQDGQGDIPGLAVAREEQLCLACHSGSPASTNVGADYVKAFRHPTTTISGIHTGPEESSPTDFGAAPANRRHAECVDCHNPHVATHDPSTPPPDDNLSRVNYGVSRVRVTNGGAGSPPTFTFVAASDTLSPPLAEYELCFKCHSSWTVQPSGQTDLAAALNPSNPSYHPVESVGRDPSIRIGAFAPGWGPTSLTRCGSCHGSDFGTTEGPHGSSYRYILRASYAASTAPRTMTSDEICFTCHAYDVYANPTSSAATLTQSRFNEPGDAKGHARHVGEENVPCYGCHVTHGSSTLPHLLVTGRIPGIAAYTETPTGGTCQPTCHGSESYSVNYAR